MTSTTNKPATWFWIVSAIALVWNLMGVMAFINQVTMSPETFQALPEQQKAIYANTPSWATSAFALAVFGGTLGSILLLVRRKLASQVLIGSFVGILIQMFHSFFMSNSIEVFGPGGMVMPIMILIIAAYLIWFSRQATAKGWLR